MALVSNVGAGSGLPIQDLVKQLVEAEGAGPSAAIARREARANQQLSAIGTLKGAFSTLQTAIRAFESTTLFSGRKLSLSETGFFTATASASAETGSFDVEVVSLAAAHKLISNPIANGGPTGQGTLNIQAGSVNVNVVVDADNDTVEGLRDSINEAVAGQGLRATIIESDDGTSLVLTALATGTANDITITQTVGGNTLKAFTTNQPVPADGLQEQDAASDAQIKIEGQLRTESTNHFDEVVTGVDLDLKDETAVGESVKVTVSEDTGAAKKAIEAFVSAYNGVRDAIATVTAVDLEKKTAQPLSADALTRGAATQLQQSLFQVNLAASRLGINVGLSADDKGKLSFDSSKFDAALAADPEAVAKVFSGRSGTLHSQFSPLVERLLGSGGSFAIRESNLKAQLDQAAEQREALAARLAQVEARYKKQFVALDGLLSKLSSTSQSLASQLATLPGA